MKWLSFVCCSRKESWVDLVCLITGLLACSFIKLTIQTYVYLYACALYCCLANTHTYLPLLGKEQ